MNSLKETLFLLSNSNAAGNVAEASELAYKKLSEYCETQKTHTLTVTGFLKGESDYTLMLDAHIDQISMVVTDIDENGFLTVSKAGGIDIRALPSRTVTVYGKEIIPAVFCSTPPHLAKDKENFNDISKIKLDTCLGKKAENIVSVGDIVVFEGGTAELLNGRVMGKSFDNRASVACLIEIAKRLKNEKLPFNVAFVLSDGEELGLRGSKTATFKINPNEALVLDVTFGDGVGISAEESGKIGFGPLVGISPILNKEISKKLIRVAEENNIPYQIEVMSSSTGTNADVVSVTREGVKTCTLSLPIRNMHTEVEILDLKDLEYTCEIVCKYILSGGAFCA